MAAEDEGDVPVQTATSRHDPVLTSLPKYRRGQDVDYKKVKDKKLRGHLQKMQKRFGEAVYKSAQSDLLLLEDRGYLEAEGMEKTYKFKQEQIRNEVDITTAQKGFALDLPDFGPYEIDYSRNGRHLLLGGRKGHLAAVDWREGKLFCEVQVKETVRAVKWLHNESMFAAAQKKYVYIYDKDGLEIHCLRSHMEVVDMEFLPYHFLLVTAGNAGYLKYQDISTGTIICEHRTKLGTPTSMCQNPWNAIIHLGHSNGTVTFWSPNMSTPLVKMFTHHGPVRSLAIDREGRYMVSAGADHRVKIWDVRNYREVHSYYTQRPAEQVTLSELGLLGVGWGSHVAIWKDALQRKQQSPYMSHDIPGSSVSCLRFCPYDDVLGIGHSGGFASLIVPGAGEPNFDAREANPFQTPKQRRETEVRSLLGKIQPEMIALEPDFIGNIDRQSKEAGGKEKSGNKPVENAMVLKEKARGKNSTMKRYLRKRSMNIIDERKARIEAVKKREKERLERNSGKEEKKLPPVLARFERKET